MALRIALRIALVQMNPVIGDLAGNSDKIVEAAHSAHAQGAHILLTPELALCGFPPEDLLLRPDFYRQNAYALEMLAQRLKVFEGLEVMVGHPYCSSLDITPTSTIHRSLENAPIDTFNSVTRLVNGRIEGRYDKRILAATQVFDEYRYFVAGNTPLVFDVQGIRCTLLICEDIWNPIPLLEARAQGAQLALVLNGSPWHQGKPALRLEKIRDMVRQARAIPGPLGLVYLNVVGGQDELIFDGGSFALDAQGEVVMQLPQFKEVLAWLDCQIGSTEKGASFIKASENTCAQDLPTQCKNGIALTQEEPLQQINYLDLRGECTVLGDDIAQIYEALVLSVRDYCHKNGFKEALIGLSGGVDSALTLAIACDALGAEQVHAVMMPSKYTAQISLEDARTLSRNCGVRYTELSVMSALQACTATLLPALFADESQTHASTVTEENLQARIRGMFLMALSNQSGALVLTTGNKSEMAVGYCTLYGDMAGGFAVLKDVLKTTVYALCRYRNALSQEKASRSASAPISSLIPERILTRPPSAELRDNQTDQDSLPPYAVLDDIVQKVMEEHAGKAELLAMGHTPAHIEQILSLLWRNEYKRYQAPVGPRVTRRGFGRDWRYPLSFR